ncbi:group II intron maturase-specific domain-containing protein [Enterobacter asburiae]
MSGRAAKAIRQTVRSWDLSHKTPLSLEVMARWLNPMLRGWVKYYGCFYRSAMNCIATHVDLHLAKWIARKYKRVHGSLAQAYEWLSVTARNRNPSDSQSAPFSAQIK